MDNIIRKIKSYYPISEGSLDVLKYHFKQHSFPAKTIIIQANHLDKQIYFIEKGITRSYILHNGKEITTWFSMEGDVETLEETLVYSISIEVLNSLYKSYIDIANWMRILQQENFLKLQDTHISRLILSAQERYEKLVQEYPDIFSRVNLGHISTFLGITQQSLSRIRASY